MSNAHTRVFSLDKKRQKYREIVSFVYNFMALFKLGKIRTVILHEYFFGSFFITKAIIHGIWMLHTQISAQLSEKCWVTVLPDIHFLPFSRLLSQLVNKCKKRKIKDSMCVKCSILQRMSLLLHSKNTIRPLFKYLCVRMWSRIFSEEIFVSYALYSIFCNFVRPTTKQSKK